MRAHLDAPNSPNLNTVSKYGSYYNRTTDEHSGAYRNELLPTRLNDFRDDKGRKVFGRLINIM